MTIDEDGVKATQVAEPSAAALDVFEEIGLPAPPTLLAVSAAPLPASDD